MGSVAPWHVGSSWLCPLRWPADSCPLCHQAPVVDADAAQTRCPQGPQAASSLPLGAGGSVRAAASPPASSVCTLAFSRTSCGQAHTAFSGWLLPLSNVHLRATMSVIGLIAQFSFSSLALNNSPPSGCPIVLFIRSPAEGHLESLYCLSGLLEWEVDSKQSPLLTSELSSDLSELLGRGGVATWTLVLCCPPFPRALDLTGCCSRTLQPSVQGTPEVPLGEAIPPTVRSW